jgi:alanine racemase
MKCPEWYIMDNKFQYSTWVEISLGALENNVKLLKQISTVPVMAVVKGNAYGHGAVMVSRTAIQAGASWLGVARIEEAIELRANGLACPILVMGYIPLERFSDAIIQNISLTIWDEEQARQASMIAQSIGKLAWVHLKVDTGMSRLGIQIEAAAKFAKKLAHLQGILVEGIFTHFANADIPSNGETQKQVQRFNQLLQELKIADICPKWVHASNSAGSLLNPEAAYDMVRSGIALYGLHPSQECLLPERFQPVLAWKTVLSQVKVLPEGRGISYGHEYVTTACERIGTIPVGYADGYRRVKGNNVLVHGRHVPVIGRVCMDQCCIQLDAVPEAQTGDEVVLIGNQADSTIRTEDVAQIWKTNNYDVVCGIAARVPRLYR